MLTLKIHLIGTEPLVTRTFKVSAKTTMYDGKNGEIDPPAPFESDPHAPLQIDPLKTEQIDPLIRV
jgi:hypothetical protein